MATATVRPATDDDVGAIMAIQDRTWRTACAGLLPEAKTVIQAGDQVYLAAVSGHIAEALAIAALPPSEDSDNA